MWYNDYQFNISTHDIVQGIQSGLKGILFIFRSFKMKRLKPYRKFMSKKIKRDIDPKPKKILNKK
jgi:hypothetical protein